MQNGISMENPNENRNKFWLKLNQAKKYRLFVFQLNLTNEYLTGFSSDSIHVRMAH